MRRVSDATTTVEIPRKKSFWSFLNFSSYSSSSSSSSSRDLMQQQRKESTSDRVQTKIGKAEVAAESSSSFGRKVARSRSVGCGSRSFSGDFLERISTGFGDCTLRRVESHRERIKGSGKKLSGNDVQRVKERVGCARIFIGGGYDFDSEVGSNTGRASASASAIAGGRNRQLGVGICGPNGII
ncbi:uncharacterized protein A4U43_C02F14110 [Asparagus officinalis]|uniref:Uncharacterized protein n=2 Tax=Asparagus officinalis TaxID=4686 RepID=A0A5P1FN17_ASPOF|nr:uncharacterized protein A4U43_C02F14110 [Asparagus officinalis]